jgi:hypothetical protein
VTDALRKDSNCEPMTKRIEHGAKGILVA